MGAGKDRSVFQCMACGELHEVNMIYNSEDDIYIKMKCKKCHKDTLHLYCGDLNDQYIYFSLNQDYRYYQYNTK
jgi:hypothetical protein